jgi:hypothetical protein
MVPGMATGYQIGRQGVTSVPEYGMATGGASCGYSTPADMTRYLAALVGGGRNECGVVLNP